MLGADQCESNASWSLPRQCLRTASAASDAGMNSLSGGSEMAQIQFAL
jgi:hypothetical protein